jgi:hypothetical protein
MPFSKYRPLTYTSMDWQTLSEAHRLASRELGRHPKNHEHSDRLARTILNFYDRGIKDVGVLSSLAANREKALDATLAKETRIAERRKREADAKNNIEEHQARG